MIDVSSIINDPDFAQPEGITVTRSKGSFQLGGWKNSQTVFQVSGVVENLNQNDIVQLPEGDRSTGGIAIWTNRQLYATHSDDTDGLSDIITYHGQDWRIYQVWDRSDWGYFKAIATRISGK